MGEFALKEEERYTRNKIKLEEGQEELVRTPVSVDDILAVVITTTGQSKKVRKNKILDKELVVLNKE
jgi:hypothetical protein